MKVVFFGTPEFAVASLDAIMKSQHEVAAVVTVPDKPAGRGQKMLQSAVKEYAISHSLPLIQPEKLRSEEFLEQLRSIDADCFVVVAFRMMPECVWAMPKMGTFNLHAALLPRFRGAAPINWAIINGEKTTGVTTFLLNHRIDEGNILMQESTPIGERETVGMLYDRLSAMGSNLVVKTLDGLAAGTLTPRVQTGEPCLAPKIFKDDCRLNFSGTVDETDRLIRGLSPYPAAFAVLKSPSGAEVPFKIFEAVPQKETHSLPCGTLVCDGKTTIKIALTDGFINILTLQMAGKKKNSVQDFLRGNQLTDWQTATN